MIAFQFFDLPLFMQVLEACYIFHVQRRFFFPASFVGWAHFLVSDLRLFRQNQANILRLSTLEKLSVKPVQLLLVRCVCCLDLGQHLFVNDLL